MPQYTPEFQESLDAVLRIDPSLKKTVEANEFKAFLYPKPSFPSSFEYLARGVISQQVSGAAARSICKSFMGLCGSETDFPTPQKVLEFDVDQMRDAGLSRRKGSYVRGLAEAYENGEMSDELLQSLDDDEVVDKIVSLHGFGPWSAQMFLVFYMHRMNVFSPADVGIQRGMRRYLKQRPELLKQASGLEDPPPSPGKSKKAQAKSPVPPDLIHMDRIAQKFSPHRTAFQMILWKLSDIEMDTVEARDEDEDEKRERLQAMAKRRKINAPVEVVAQKKSEAKVEASDEENGKESGDEKQGNDAEDAKEEDDDAARAGSGTDSNKGIDRRGKSSSRGRPKKRVKTEDEDSGANGSNAKSSNESEESSEEPAPKAKSGGKSKGGRPRKQQKQS